MEPHYTIVLIFPNFRLYQNFIVTPHQPPLSLGYLSAMLKKHGIRYRVLDAAASKINNKELLGYIKKYNPEYVGFTLNVSTAYSGINEAKLIKKHFPHISIIMGGPWAHANYELLLNQKIADIVCFGEGEFTLIKIIQANKDITKYEAIDGIAYRKNQTIVKTKPCMPIMDIDTIPHPEWDQFPINGYDVIHRNAPFFPIITSRGCPYDCINCTKIIHGYQARLRSVENILLELDYLKKEFNAKEIIIEDDIFNVNLARAKTLLRAIIKRNYSFKIQLSNGIRADNIDEEFAKLLRLAGCYRVSIGIESASPNVIKFLQKKLDLTAVDRCIKILKKHKIIVYGYFILGLPVETKNSMIYSIDIADRMNLDIVNFFALIVFPGTKLYDYIKKSNMAKNDNYMISDVNYHTTALSFQPPKFTQRDYDRARLYYIIRFFLNPKKFFHFIKVLNQTELIYVIRRSVSFLLNKLSSKRH